MRWQRQTTLGILQIEVIMADEIALSSMLGAAVYDSSRVLAGHVREVALSPQDDPNRISEFVVRTSHGDRLLPAKAVCSLEGTTFRASPRLQHCPPLPRPTPLL